MPVCHRDSLGGFLPKLAQLDAPDTPAIPVIVANGTTLYRMQNVLPLNTPANT